MLEGGYNVEFKSGNQTSVDGETVVISCVLYIKKLTAFLY